MSAAPAIEEAPIAAVPLAEPPPLPWRRIAVGGVALWLATRVGFLLLTYVTGILNAHDVVRQGGFVASTQTPLALLQGWDQWDTHWFLLISRLGYSTPQETAFFPLYPALTSGLAFILGDGAGAVWPAPDPLRLGAALAISNVATLVAFVGTGLLAAHEEGPTSEWWRPTRIMAAYPLAFFLAAAYTEALFLAFAVLTLLLARRGHWRWAAATAFFGSLTRPTGVILILPLAWEFGRQHGWWAAASWRDGGWRRRVTWLTASEFVPLMAAVPLAVLLYGAYLWWRFGHPLLFVSAEQAWSRQAWPIWRTGRAVVGHLARTPNWSYWQLLQLLDVGLLMLFFAIVVLAIRRTPFALTLYMLGLFYLSVSTPLTSVPDIVTAAGRFLVVSIPVFLILGRWSRERPWLDMLLVSCGFMVQAALVTFWLTGGWVE